MASHGRRFATKKTIIHKQAKARRHAREVYKRRKLRQVKQMQNNVKRQLNELKHSDYQKATQWKYRENKHLLDNLDKNSTLTDIRRVKTAVHSYNTQAVHNRATAKKMYQTSMKTLENHISKPEQRKKLESYMENPRGGKEYASGVFERMSKISDYLQTAGNASSYNSDEILEAAANTSTIDSGLHYLGDQTDTDTNFTLE